MTTEQLEANFKMPPAPEGSQVSDRDGATAPAGLPTPEPTDFKTDQWVDVYRVVQDHQRSCDWPNQEWSKRLHELATLLICKLELGIPLPPIRIEPTNIKTPAKYCRGHDGYALQGALIFNEKWLRGEATGAKPYQLPSLLFKLLLLAWQDVHSLVGPQDFQIMLKELGVRLYNDGRIAFLPPDKVGQVGKFPKLLAMQKIDFPDKPFFPGKKPDGDPDKKPVGKSTSTLWSCGCQKVRVGTKQFSAACTRCNSKFRQVYPV